MAIAAAYLDPRFLKTVETVTANDDVIRPGEFHPQALSEPDVHVSAHPAPVIQPSTIE